MSDHSGNQSLVQRWWFRVRYHRWITTILVFAAVACLIGTVHYVIESLQQRVTLLTGPEGSFNNDIGETLHDGFLQEPAWRLWGRSFYFTALDTNGSQENRSRVNNDRQGRLLGVALDGFTDTPHVRTMLHLTDVPLLILANPDFLEKVAEFPNSASADGPSPPDFVTKIKRPGSSETIAEVAINLQPDAPAEPTFAQIANYATAGNACNFYLGAGGSGTRSLAREVLKSYKVPVDSVDRLDQLSFTDAAAALESKKLDVVFFLLPTGTDYIVDLIRHGGASIVGLDQTAGFISRNQFLRARTIVEGTFANNLPARPVSTVQARLVLICSDCMPTDAAYWLTASIARYLRQDEEIAPNLARDLVPGADGAAYEMHEGARMFYEQRDPWYIIGSLTSIKWLLGGFGLLATAFLSAFLPDFMHTRRWWPKRMDASETNSKTNVPLEATPSLKTEPQTPDSLLREADQLSDDIRKPASQASDSQREELSNRLEVLERAVAAIKTSSPADEKSIDLVRVALKEVKEELRQLQAVKTPAVPTPPLKAGPAAESKASGE